jgi:thiamine-phosphate pyrophosphorylase
VVVPQAGLAVTKKRSLDALLVTFVTDGKGDESRLCSLVEAALRGGVRAVQLREPLMSAAQLARACERLLGAIRAVHGVLLVNDRCDLAAAGLCDGVQVGHRSLPVELARRACGPEALLGASCHSPLELSNAAAAGADFALLSPVWATSSKPGLVGLGVERAGQWTRETQLPVLWLGGCSAAKALEAESFPLAQKPIGIAAISAIADAADPELATRALVSSWRAALVDRSARSSRG